MRFEGAGGAVVDFFGPTDFLRMHETYSTVDHDAPDSPESLLIGGPILTHRREAARANPIRYIDGGVPPFLIAHGDRDDIVPLQQSRLLYRALRDRGDTANLMVVHDDGHGFSDRAVYDRVDTFFDRYLKGS